MMQQDKQNDNLQHVFIIGSKGIPAAYGGFETFVEKLTQYRMDNKIQYHVACLSDNREEFEHNHAHCFNLAVPDIGAAKAICYDMAAFRFCLQYIRDNHIDHAIVYVLACRIGPFLWFFKKILLKTGGTIFVNPDGHEWKRSKWNWFIRKYWKLSERLMIKHAGLLICDSKNIEKYVKEIYAKYQPETKYIAYGCDSHPEIQEDNCLLSDWYQKYGLKEKGYYLVVGRFVPENNYETMLREFMDSGTDRRLVIITTGNDVLFGKMERKVHFKSDSRIIFAGTVYNQKLLKQIRKNAYGYLHGHEVGGTNPSLLEALGYTDLNLLLDVSFNREVAEEAALYWNKKEGSLAGLIDKVEKMMPEEITKLGKKARERIRAAYTWEHIVEEYEKLFLCGRNEC